MATPCWPAPVSAMTRRLPIRTASRTWPSVLFSLCAPVWSRSSRLSHTSAPPQRSVSRDGERQRGRTAGEAAQVERERLGERGVDARLRPRLVELVERRDQRLRDVAAPVLSERTRCITSSFSAAPDRGHEGAQLRRGPSPLPTALPRSPRPRPTGLHRAIASTTFSGVSPPASSSGTSRPRARGQPRSSRSARPRRRTRRPPASRRTARGARRDLRRAGPIRGRPGRPARAERRATRSRRAARLRGAGRRESRAPRPPGATSSGGWFTNTPTAAMPSGSRARSSRARVERRRTACSPARS